MPKNNSVFSQARTALDRVKMETENIILRNLYYTET